MQRIALNSSHWGAFCPLVKDERIVGACPVEFDPAPSRILQSIPDAVHHRSRIDQPAIRVGWLKHDPGGASDGRGSDAYVRVSWDRALDLIAYELKRVIAEHGNQAIFGGSYGWSSAGRFHHAKTQLQRFLVRIGGFTDAKDTYSNAAGSVLVKHIVGSSDLVRGGSSWQSIVENTELFVAFGGIPTRNTQVTPGGTAAHTTPDWLMQAKAAEIAFCNIGPIRDDAAALLEAHWLAPRPHTDSAIMLGIAHTLLVEELHDKQFLNQYCVGFDQFADYVLGHVDGTAKSAEWAANVSEVSAHAIRELARRMARSRTFIMANWSLQRSHHGEQPFWLVIVLAAMLGKIGLPGGGFGFGYGSMEGLAQPRPETTVQSLPIGKNPVSSFIPVARVADMLLNPHQPFQYNGSNLTYPDIRLIYWCGGNPFHHHQDLNHLVLAWRRPETIIVNEPWWTATARHADIVLPATTTLERDDLGASPFDRFIIAMKRAIRPVGQSRDDFAIFADLADHFSCRDSFTEGRTASESLRYLYESARQRASRAQIEVPHFDQFWERGYVELPVKPKSYVSFEDFRRDPAGSPLSTPSGRIEIFSSTIASFGYDDCLGHPAWFEPAEWLGSATAQRFPLHLLTTQPPTRLHGQMDMGCVSRKSKITSREPIRISLVDAASRGIRNGDIVRVFNERGALLAGVIVTYELRPGVVQISTGAWYDPLYPGSPGSLDKHGNPNVLTLDKGTSRLAQGSSAQTALVEIEKYTGELPPVTAFDPPRLIDFDKEELTSHKELTLNAAK
jgi:biotin/methionine sulfoxide reductase